LAIQEFNQALQEVDVIVAPTIPILPTAIYQREIEINGTKEPIRGLLNRLTGPTNLTGFPSLSIPCGFSDSGLPIGLQLIGSPFDEANLYRFGYAFEQESSIPTLKYDIG
jgi:aspartyl-tRNA(Asn)/glutamyl-tRNA(Gln) amidotransferase subunit A